MKKKPSLKRLLQLLETDEDTFHKDVKSIIVKTYKNELIKLGIKNPDISLDSDNNVILVHPKDSTKALITNVSILFFIEHE